MEHKTLYLQQMKIGPMDNFVYFIGDAALRDVAVVDPAWNADFLREEEKKQNVRIVSVLLTHGHPDHVNALEDLLETHDVPVYISSKEASFHTPEHKNVRTVDSDEILKVGHIQIRCLHTPGHTPGGQCFLAQGHLLTGDTLFINGCGRCDLPGGNPKTMYHSLYETIMALPDDTLIFPGHDYSRKTCDTLANQKKSNPYLLSKSLDEFLTKRMGY